MAYYIGVHWAVYVLFDAGIVPGTDGFQPVNVYPVRVTVGVDRLVP